MHDGAEGRARLALQRHQPELAGQDLTPLGQGTDNTAFVVADLVLRVSAGPGVTREARLLDLLATRLSAQLPRPRFADEDLGVLAYPLLPGRPLLGRPAFPGLGQRLGRFLRELHDLDPVVLGDLLPTDDAGPQDWLADLDGPSDLLAVLTATVPPPTRARVVAHADLGAEHLLTVEDELTGVIDWSDAALADPAVDFARLYRDFGLDLLEAVVSAYGGLPDVDRTLPRIEHYARCAALEDLQFGRTSGRPEYAQAAEVSLRRLFDAPDLLQRWR